tara:strand:- start:4556 stop:5314 length:759 start_codon:yes stop_codon:yes gene_type:complete
MNDNVELVKQNDFFGFPVCVYRFKKHSEYKDKIIGYLNEPEVGSTYYNAGSHLRTDGMTKPFIKNNHECLSDLRNAMQTATEHFYKDILKAELSLDTSTKNKSYGVESEPSITQSWVIRVPAQVSQIPQSPMEPHQHFLSPVCGAYYLKLNKNANTTGGNLLFVNPSLNSYENQGNLSILNDVLKCDGIQRTKIQTVSEGDIVLWAGVLAHTIEPISNMYDERISIIMNSCPNPLSNNTSNYVYNITPFYKE